ncbi:MAG: hypothetical protein Q4B63_08880 [Clostridium perfringens]|nr:hypothetical protein [Clostridium perfringens]
MSEKDVVTIYKEEDINALNFYYGVSSDCLTSFNKDESFNVLDKIKSLGLDYAIISRENKDLDLNLEHKNPSLSIWKYLNKSVSRFNKKNENFLVLLEFESLIPSLGKVSTLNTKSFFKGSASDFKYFAIWLLQNKDCHISINTFDKPIENFLYKDFLNEISPSLDINVRSDKKIYSSKEKNCFSLLDCGFKVGIIGQKNYKYPPYSNFSKLTCAICPKLDAKNLISAFKNKHTFFTESRTLKLIFTINDNFMGSSISKSSDLNFYIYLNDNKHKINKIEILSNGGEKIKESDNMNLNKIQYIFKKDYCEKETWYIVKVFLDSNLTAISSPIFIK